MRKALAVMSIVLLASIPDHSAPAQREAMRSIPAIPAGKENDVKFYTTDGGIVNSLSSQSNKLDLGRIRLGG